VTEEMTEHYSHVDRAEKLRAADQVVVLAAMSSRPSPRSSPRGAGRGRRRFRVRSKRLELSHRCRYQNLKPVAW
jgi:hypothetical protein